MIRIFEYDFISILNVKDTLLYYLDNSVYVKKFLLKLYSLI